MPYANAETVTLSIQDVYVRVVAVLPSGRPIIRDFCAMPDAWKWAEAFGLSYAGVVDSYWGGDFQWARA